MPSLLALRPGQVGGGLGSVLPAGLGHGEPAGGFWWNYPVLCFISVRDRCVLDSGTVLTACEGLTRSLCVSRAGTGPPDEAGPVCRYSVGILFTVDIFALISIFNIVLRYN